MIDNEQLDVVHICTQHYLHPSMTIKALEKGCDVLTEKPMSTKYEDAVKMVETADRVDKTLGVIFQNRYNPGSVFAKKILDSGELGKVLGAKLDVTWMRTDEYYSKSDWKGTWDKEGGGVMIDQAIHTFDLLATLAGRQ
jgi:predicted dehydrogenase